MNDLQPDSIISSKEGETLSDVLRRLEGPAAKRFEGATFINNTTNWGMLTPLYQGYDQSGQPLQPGYRLNTGVILGANYVGPRGCQAVSQVQPQINVLATRVEANCRIRWLPTGEEREFTWPAHVAPAGQYWRRVSFGIRDASTGWPAKDKPPMPALILEAEFGA